MARWEPLTGFWVVGKTASIRTDRNGWQMGAGFAECAATQSEQRIGESVAADLKWAWLASLTAAASMRNRQMNAIHRCPRAKLTTCRC